MSLKLSHAVVVNSRFARSANIERDTGIEALRGYVPTGRAVDVIRRVGQGLANSAAGRTFSITGPHGGGKSSMALFLGALLADPKSPEHRISVDMLREADEEAARILLSGLKSVDPSSHGFAQALVTASREPVAQTLYRAIDQLEGKPKKRGHRAAPIDVLRSFAEKRPTLIVIDEFGKNLEAFADGDADGDPYLLQELAELSQGVSALPIVVVTMQHLAFDEYVTSAATSQRREWAKVQGRFQDIPFVESAEQSRRLVASAVSVSNKRLASAIGKWIEDNSALGNDLGLGAELQEAAATYPLHPIVLAVLPQLCARFGQNERTLFSFMAGPEPRAVPSFLASTTLSKISELQFVGLDRVYDYFLESAGSSVGASGSASRWLEIENRLRDAWGLDAVEESVLKAMGVLNLVSSSGSLRASRAMLEFSLNPLLRPERSSEVRQALANLEARGIVSYRDFSDEYRIWQGSDYDLHGAIAAARAEGRALTLAELLHRTTELSPVVAGRHSQQGGILRVFSRKFVNVGDLTQSQTVPEEFDGMVVLVVEPTKLDEQALLAHQLEKPLVYVVPNQIDGIRELAVEVFALDLALARAKEGAADWVALRELNERLSAGRLALSKRVFEAWIPGNSIWTSVVDSTRSGEPVVRVLDSKGTASSHVSQVADDAYPQAPRVANEMLARRELTSQGAKARRILLEALIREPSSESLGLVGYGPERAMYEAVFRASGIHRETRSGWTITRPASPEWQPVWDELNHAVENTSDQRVSVPEVMETLALPPFGIKDGLLPVLLIAYLIEQSDDVALYEHGSLVLALDDAVVERLAKNPGNFALKYVATTKGLRSSVVHAIASEMEVSSPGGKPSFLQVVRAVFKWIKQLPPYAHAVEEGLTQAALDVRSAFRTAVEPDELFFVELPKALGERAFVAGARTDRERAKVFAEQLVRSMRELSSAYPKLLDDIRQEIAQRTGTPAVDTDELRSKLAGQGVNLEGRMLESRLNAFVSALTRDHLADDAWVENVAMVVAEGVPPRSWTRETRARFSRNLEELGGQLRRTQALLYENLSLEGEGFETRRVTVTAPSGDEVSDVFSLRDSEVSELRGLMEPVLRRASARYGTRENARRTLLALLAMDYGADSRISKPVSEVGA